MKSTVFAALLAVAAAAPQSEVRVVNQKFEMDHLGNYAYGYELDDGTASEQVGYDISHAGSFTFVADDGNTYALTYQADDNGFRPQGEHLPQPPAQIPEYALLRQEHPELFWAESASEEQQL